MRSNRFLRMASLGSLMLGTPYLSAQEVNLPCDIVEHEVLAKSSADEVAQITSFTPAEPLSRVEPKYPRTAALRNSEGWVQMSFVVDVNGNVQYPVIEDFGGDSIFKKAALNAISEWTFTPAMKDGKPTEQCHQKVQFEFTMSGQTGASRRFVREYKKTIAAIEAQDYSEAQSLIGDLHKSDELNRYENAWLWSVDATLAKDLGDTRREMASINRTLSSAKSHEKDKATFDDSYMSYLHSRLFILQASSNQFGSALETVEAIKQLPDAQARYQAIENTVAKIHEVLSSDEHIYIDILLADSGQYFHSLARNKFAFSGIDGQVNTVEVRCESRREVFTVAEDFVWTIPEAWGKCRVLVKGDANTTFDLVEISKI